MLTENAITLLIAWSAAAVALGHYAFTVNQAKRLGPWFSVRIRGTGTGTEVDVDLENSGGNAAVDCRVEVSGSTDGLKHVAWRDAIGPGSVSTLNGISPGGDRMTVEVSFGDALGMHARGRREFVRNPSGDYRLVSGGDEVRRPILGGWRSRRSGPAA